MKQASEVVVVRHWFLSGLLILIGISEEAVPATLRFAGTASSLILFFLFDMFKVCERLISSMPEFSDYFLDIPFQIAFYMLGR